MNESNDEKKSSIRTGSINYISTRKDKHRKYISISEMWNALKLNQ